MGTMRWKGLTVYGTVRGRATRVYGMKVKAAGHKGVWNYDGEGQKGP